jgi:ATP-dependent protease HslVU (ClpYQ) peptidase subunit
MAADSAVSCGDVIVGRAQKIFWTPRRQIIAACGTLADLVLFREWIVADVAHPRPVLSDEFHGIVVSHNRSVTQYYSGLTPVMFEAEFYALGSASEFGFGAMCAGASSIEAVNLAVGRVAGCGGPVQVESFNG